MKPKQALLTTPEETDSYKTEAKCPEHSAEPKKQAKPELRAKTDELAKSQPSVFLGKCVSSIDSNRGAYLVHYKDSSGNIIARWLPIMEGITINKGDEVVLVTPLGYHSPIIMGKLPYTSTHPNIKLKSGHKLIVEEEENIEGSVLKLEQSDGKIALEIHLVDETPKIYLPSKDLSLDLEGRLRISARSIDFVSKLGNVNVKANDDFKVNAERIWFN